MAAIYTHLSHPTARSSRRGLWKSLLDRFALRRQRRALGRLGPDALRDIGLTRDQAQAESQRKIWDAPRHWIC